MIEHEKLVKKGEVATFIAQTPRSVENLMRKGLPHIKLSARATRFRLSDVEAWLNERCRVTRIGKATTK